MAVETPRQTKKYRTHTKKKDRSISKGRVERRASAHGRAHAPNYSKIYSEKLPPLHLEESEFYLQAIRPDLGNLRLDSLAETVEWREEAGNPVITGTLTMRKPDPKVRPAPILHEGHRVRLYVRVGDKWVMLWEMRLVEPESASLTDWTFDLEEPFVVLQESVDDFHYTTNKKTKPHGWLCHEILIDVAKRYRIPLGKVAMGKHRIKHLSMKDSSPLAVIQRAYAMERQATGKRFIMRWVNGKLQITPMRRNPVLYTLGLQLIEATAGREAKSEKFATAVTVYGSSGKGRKKKKITRLVVDEAKVRKYGYVHKKITRGKVESQADALREGRKYLKEKSERKKTIGVTHPGLAFLRRGDGVRIDLPEEGFTGKQGIVFCTDYTKTLQGGEFNIDANFDRKDPYITDADRRNVKDTSKRKTKRKKRGEAK